MKRFVLLFATLIIPAVARPVTGTLQVDDYWYTVELDTPMAWTHHATTAIAGYVNESVPARQRQSAFVRCH
ncbi:MAG: hypothetical protein IPK97_06280 [Ahniella sp.]|nr:hypothetical protein [Ahniella sp.]